MGTTSFGAGMSESSNFLSRFAIFKTTDMVTRNDNIQRLSNDHIDVVKRGFLLIEYSFTIPSHNWK
jgi:hypothetical protein